MTFNDTAILLTVLHLSLCWCGLLELICHVTPPSFCPRTACDVLVYTVCNPLADIMVCFVHIGPGKR